MFAWLLCLLYAGGCSGSSSSGTIAAIASSVTIIVIALLVSVVIHIVILVYHLNVKKRQGNNTFRIASIAAQSGQDSNLAQDGINEDMDHIHLNTGQAAISNEIKRSIWASGASRLS